jgi:hypothetical protein
MATKAKGKKKALKHDPDLRPGKGIVFPEERLGDLVTVKGVLDKLEDSSASTADFLQQHFGEPIESTDRFGTKFLAGVSVDGRGEELRVCVVHKVLKNKDESIRIEIRKWYRPSEG